MAEGEHPREFPDVNQKLAAPKKLSAFEKERQAAQAKEKRAEAENAAALKAFEDSFADGQEDGDDDDAFSQLTGGRGPPPGTRGSDLGNGPPPGRYGMPPGFRSGSSGLGPPPPSLKRKRALDEMREAQEVRREQEALGYDDATSDPRATPQPILQDEERDIDAPRPTIQLSSLPPSVSTEEVREMLKYHLEIYSVKILPTVGAGPNVKRSMSAIVTLAAEVTTAQIDTAVSALKDKYLGCGFYLSISRHLSSTALHPSMSGTTGAAQSTEPFGAVKPRDPHARSSMRNAPPPMDYRGFAPPESYDSPARSGYGMVPQPDASVAVRPPLNIEAIKAVHTVVDALLLEPDAERAVQMEALLMSLPTVQKDERFAFLYDSRSPAGVYYRFLLWSPEDPDEAVRDMKRGARGAERIHDDVAIDWLPPYAHVPFPDLKSLEQAVTDMDYVSSDEDSDDEAGERQFNSGREGDGINETLEKQNLSPLKRAKLVHLLSRLPTTNTKLRKGDVARVTHFAINHAGAGAEEIVDLLLLNIEKPFSTSLAAKYEDLDQEQDEEDVYEPDEDLTNLGSPAAQVQRESKRDEDPSNAKLIALYLISDILSASSTAGARNAWKYRQLFETGFKHQKTFEHLGKLDRALSWGRMKSEQWKRKIGVVFGIWESWSVFSSEVQAELKQSFLEPPLNDEEKAAALAEAEREERKKQEEKWMGRFKKVEPIEASSASGSPAPAQPPVATIQSVKDSLGSAPPSGLDDLPRNDDTNSRLTSGVLDGRPTDDMADRLPMNGKAKGAPIGGLDGTTEEKPAAGKSQGFTAAASGKPTGPRRRMRAEDMFLDSDEG